MEGERKEFLLNHGDDVDENDEFRLFTMVGSGLDFLFLESAIVELMMLD